jgi:hypothetical protein
MAKMGTPPQPPREWGRMVVHFQDQEAQDLFRGQLVAQFQVLEEPRLFQGTAVRFPILAMVGASLGPNKEEEEVWGRFLAGVEVFA